MYRSYPCLALSLLVGCSVFDSDDGTRAVTGSTISSWTMGVVVQATATACVDDGMVHTAQWGVDCAVASAVGDLDGSFRIEGLEPEVYQIYVDGPEPWGDHATLVSLVDDNAAVSLELYPKSIASVLVTQDFEFAEPQLKFSAGPAAECEPNNLVVDLPSYESKILMDDGVDGCLEIENNDFVGQVAFTETLRPPLAGECGDDWCPEWTVVSRTPHRRGTVNAVLNFEDKQVQLSGEWLE